MIIYTATYSHVKELRHAGITAVSIDRKPPSNFRGQVYKLLTPFSYMGEHMDVGQYTREYQKVLHPLDAKECETDLARMANGGNCALISTDTENGKLLRILAMSWFSRNGITVKEFKPVRSEQDTAKQLQMFEP